MSDENTDVIASLLARAEAAEKERDGYLARLDEQVVWRQREEVRAEAAEALCATLEAALREAGAILEVGNDYDSLLLNDIDRWWDDTAAPALAATQPAEEEGT